MPSELAYTGPFQVTDIDEVLNIPVGKMVLSPTRTYLPILVPIFQHHRSAIHGIIHCSGGAQTKCLKFVDNVHIIKDNLFPTPRLFDLIQTHSGTSWDEMYRVFNMGHRLEMYVEESSAEELIGIAGEFGVNAQVVGRVEAAEQKQLTIQSAAGTFTYSS